MEPIVELLARLRHEAVLADRDATGPDEVAVGPETYNDLRRRISPVSTTSPISAQDGYLRAFGSVPIVVDPRIPDGVAAFIYPDGRHLELDLLPALERGVPYTAPGVQRGYLLQESEGAPLGLLRSTRGRMVTLLDAVTGRVVEVARMSVVEWVAFERTPLGWIGTYRAMFDPPSVLKITTC